MRAVSIICGAALFGIALTAHPDELAELTSAAFQTYTQTQALNEQMREATARYMERSRPLIGARKVLEGKPLSKEEIARRQEQVNEFEKRLSYMREILKLAQITDPKERKRLAAENTAKIDALKAEQKKETAAIQAKLAAVAEPGKKDGERLANLLGPFFREPTEGKFKGLKLAARKARIEDGVVYQTWANDKGKLEAWVHLQIRQRDKISADAPKLNDKYEIQRADDKQIWVWLGNYQAIFALTRKEWLSKEQFFEAFQVLVDLDGLAKVAAAAASPAEPPAEK